MYTVPSTVLSVGGGSVRLWEGKEDEKRVANRRDGCKQGRG